MDTLEAVAWLHGVFRKEKQIDHPQAVTVVQTARTLLGNAVAQLSLDHQKALVKHVNKSLHPLSGASCQK